jgi:zinc protease
MVADALLSGAKPIGLGGGGGRSARLYKAMVATEIAASAGSYFSLHKDPHLFTLGASAKAGDGHLEALQNMEAAHFEEIRKLQEDEIPQEELDKAVRQSRAQFVYSGDSVTNQAYVLGSLESIYSANLYDEALEKLAAVTPEDVRRVARMYLTERNRTVGWFIPTEEETIGEG